MPLLETGYEKVRIFGSAPFLLPGFRGTGVVLSSPAHWMHG